MEVKPQHVAEVNERIAELEAKLERLDNDRLHYTEREDLKRELELNGPIANDHELSERLSSALVGLRDYRDQLALRAGIDAETLKEAPVGDIFAKAKESERAAIEAIQSAEARRRDLAYRLFFSDDDEETLRFELAGIEEDLREAQAERERVKLAVAEHQKREHERTSDQPGRITVRGRQ